MLLLSLPQIELLKKEAVIVIEERRIRIRELPILSRENETRL
ncbi:MAG: hypothetical protein ACETWM_00730 [Candidatus Lokiarchaeia archaeon]